MKDILLQAACLVEMEKRSADAVYGPIRSSAEGAGVLAEEIQEFYDESLYFHMSNNSSISDLLRTVRMCEQNELMAWLQECRKNAMHAAAEAVQVAAVCDRFIEYLVKKEEEKHGHALEGDGQ